MDWFNPEDRHKFNAKAILSIKVSPEKDIGTWNNSLSDIADQTLIDKGSSVYEQITLLVNGTKVVFSGTFLQSDTDHFAESSITIDGSMREPEFLFHFTKITPVN